MSLPQIVIPRPVEKDEWQLVLQQSNWTPPDINYGLQGQWQSSQAAPLKMPTIEDLAIVLRLLKEEDKATLREALK